MEDEIIDRTDYGLSEEKAGIEKSPSKKLVEIDETIEGYANNPINKPLGLFQDKFLTNERMGYEQFIALNTSLSKFSRLVDEYYMYQDMDIVKIMQEVLTRYKNWITTMRQSIFLVQDLVPEIKEIVDKHYINKTEYELLQEDYKLRFEEMGKHWEQLLIKKDKGTEKWYVDVPREIVEKYKLNEDETIFLHKTNEQWDSWGRDKEKEE